MRKEQSEPSKLIKRAKKLVLNASGVQLRILGWPSSSRGGVEAPPKGIIAPPFLPRGALLHYIVSR
ncbi:hypothetical protein TorRG33x02_199080, partial [Trema orientale]